MIDQPAYQASLVYSLNALCLGHLRTFSEKIFVVTFKNMSVDNIFHHILVVTVKGRRDLKERNLSAQLSAEIWSRRPITVTTSIYVRIFVNRIVYFLLHLLSSGFIFLITYSLWLIDWLIDGWIDRLIDWSISRK